MKRVMIVLGVVTVLVSSMIVGYGGGEKKYIGKYVSEDTVFDMSSMSQIYQVLEIKKDGTWEILPNLWGESSTGEWKVDKDGIVLYAGRSRIPKIIGEIEGNLLIDRLSGETFVRQEKEEGPYLIATPDQLNNVRNLLDKHFKQIADIDLSGYKNWEPIGVFVVWGGPKNKPFTGTYDGNDYKITNLTINRPETDQVGLFGYLSSNSTIKNVALETVNVTGKVSVGGLVGWNTGDITDSYATGKVTGDYRVGGLVGYNYLGDITDSYATGKVTGKDYVGGLVGDSYGTITDSYYDKNTTGQDDTGKGIPKTTSEMMQQSTFENWDFDNTWAIDEGKSYPYKTVKVVFEEKEEQESFLIPLEEGTYEKAQGFKGTVYEGLFHLGRDYCVKKAGENKDGSLHGTTVYPIGEGIVVDLRFNKYPAKDPEKWKNGDGVGNYVTINHGNSIVAVYMHLAKVEVSRDQKVTAQTPLGEAGDIILHPEVTGKMCPHLHLEIRKNGVISLHVPPNQRYGYISQDGTTKIVERERIENVLEWIDLNFYDSDSILATRKASPKVEPEVKVVNESEIVPDKKVYTVQVGTFSAEGDALNLAKEIKSKGYQTYVIKGKTLYKVQVGEFKSYQEAQNISQKLKELGYPIFITTR